MRSDLRKDYKKENVVATEQMEKALYLMEIISTDYGSGE